MWNWQVFLIVLINLGIFNLRKSFKGDLEREIGGGRMLGEYIYCLCCYNNYIFNG